MADIVLFPSADLHVAMVGAPFLRVRVMYRDVDPHDPLAYVLTDVTETSVFTFVEPFAPVGQRLPADAPRVDDSAGQDLGLVRVTRPGIFLFQVTYADADDDNHTMVARLQVHHEIHAWWFGTRSITTAVDTVAHAQPSIYAEFGDDGPDIRSDLVGDITGHGYVTLSSADPAHITVNPDGRLRGLAETAGPVVITGDFLGSTQTLTATAVNFGQVRDGLQTVRAADLTDPTMVNMLFLSEGFQDTADDRSLFDEIVTKAVDKLFHDSRHEPYGMLVDSFNVFKHFVPSNDSGTTLSYRLTETATDKIPRGRPIPSDAAPGGSDHYTVDQLIARVGPPRRDETTPYDELTTAWEHQNLTGYDPTGVNEDLVDAWRLQYQHGILSTADTIFGLNHGIRWGDRTSDTLPAAPAHHDDGSDRFRRFLAKVYQFWPTEQRAALELDPRRHPPERVDPFRASPGNAVMRYVAGLRTADTHQPLGDVWLPDPTQFRPSRGLLGIIIKDSLFGGESIQNRTMLALTVNHLEAVRSQYTDPAARRELTRILDDKTKVDYGELIDTVAHEFGHSFNLGDEYEFMPGDSPDARLTGDMVSDNLTRLGHLRPPNAPPGDRHIDPSRIKWLSLPRMIRSSRLVRASVESSAGLVVALEQHQMSDWRRAKKWDKRASILAFDVTPAGRRLPLGTEPEDTLTDLSIVDVDTAQSTVTLGGTNLPARPLPVYPTGSVVYLANDGDNVTVVKPQVLAVLLHNSLPLNVDPNHGGVNDAKLDSPVLIPALRMPCHPLEIVGLFEGGQTSVRGIYRPTGECKMRSHAGEKDEGEFCFVCKWLIVNRVDPGLHAYLDRLYPEKSCGG